MKLETEITCEIDKAKRPRRVKYDVGLQLIHLDKGCSLSSAYFEIPATYMEKTSINEPRYVNDPVPFNLTVYDIWQEFNQITEPKKSQIRTISLKPIKELPLNNLHEMLKQSLLENTDGFEAYKSGTMPVWGTVTLSMIAIFIIIMAVALFGYYSLKRRTKHTPGRASYNVVSGEVDFDRSRAPVEIVSEISTPTSRKRTAAVEMQNDAKKPRPSSDLETADDINPLTITERVPEALPGTSDTDHDMTLNTKGLVNETQDEQTAPEPAKKRRF